MTMKVDNDEFPYTITCDTPPPSGPLLGSCQTLRNKLPWGQDIQRFGPKASSPEIDTPFSIYSGENSVYEY